MFVRKISLMIIASAVLVSCTVKENRDECPCLLTVSTSASAQDIHVAAWNGKTEMINNTMERGQYEGTYVVAPRCAALRTVAYVKTGLDMYVRDGVIRVIESAQADSLYAGFAEVDCLAENAAVYIARHKQFSTIELYFDKMPAGEGFPYRLEIMGECNGLDLRTDTSIIGSFKYAPKMTEGISTTFRVLRQGEGLLMLYMYDKSTGETKAVLDLGAKIHDEGFNWEAADLGDIRVVINAGELKPFIQTVEWTSGGNEYKIDY